ncbi:hypothetical protein A5662_18340 [Mycobacteriaceae bacterium 1482268.1]|nr:hypothetical protein A5662_18340 [Mycobacteriaceae bacterium 1482268.1]
MFGGEGGSQDSRIVGGMGAVYGRVAEAGVTLAAAGGAVGVWGVVGTDGGRGGPPDARPLAKPCDRSLAAVVGVGTPAGDVGAEGMLGVLGMDGVLGMLGMDGIDGVFIPPLDTGDGVLIGGMMGVLGCACCTAGAGDPLEGWTTSARPGLGLNSPGNGGPSGFLTSPGEFFTRSSRPGSDGAGFGTSFVCCWGC